jgi:hypothetical protein
MTDYLVCADTNLCETAQEQGLFIVNPGVALLELRQPFGLGDLRADILDDALAFSQVHPGKAADAVDARGLE